MWTYDAGGNITSRSEYAYTTATLDTLGTALDTVPYTYYTGTWRDRLIGYDGNTISTDRIGNMTGDGTWTYTWEHGRQLAGISGTIQAPSASVMPLSESDVKNGLYTDDDGEIRYYVDGVATYAGLVSWNGYY